MGILIVDDEPSVRLMLQTILEDAGYGDVAVAESAQAAFSRLGVGEPSFNPMSIDLVLMDISMPGTDGVEACRCIKSVPQLQDIPVMMVTGVAGSTELEAAFAAGAVDYIIKPPNIVEMLARVRSTLDLKREMDRRKSAYVSGLEEKNRELELAFVQLEQKNRELEEASLAKTQILATATHELKTPLTSIVGYVDRMLMRQDSVGWLNQKQQRYLEAVRKNAHRLKALVDDLLDVSRIEAGVLDLRPIDLDIRAEIEDVVQSMNHQLTDRNMEVALDLPPDLGKVRADRLRFSQIMSNLLSNACKYSPTGSTLRVAASEDFHRVQIDVADNGVGISNDDLSKLFTKFFRADNSPTREVSGYGLGLYIVRHLVEAHGGTIWADSELGKGTSFHFTLNKSGPSAAHSDSPTLAEPG